MNKIYPKLSLAIDAAANDLYRGGTVTPQLKWHAQPIDKSMIELLNHSLVACVPETIPELVAETSPNLPWAEEHFKERISRVPHNPPPSHVRWPFAQRGNDKHTKGEHDLFSHTYPERMWPKYNLGDIRHKARDKRVRTGIRYWYGDLDTLVDLFVFDPHTRQAYLPIWFPEDLDAAARGERVPCTLGYHFILRDRWMHIVYPIRSCDFVRHFRDDIYMACRLLQWVLNECRARYNTCVHRTVTFDWDCVIPGTIKMDITSLHAFEHERETVRRYKGVNPREEGSVVQGKTT
jgi:hypothetical protein